MKHYRLVNDYQCGLSIETYYVHKETPKGYWIGHNQFYKDNLRWVSKTSKKRFAYPSKEEAINAYIHRALSCIIHCERIIENAKSGIYRLLNSEDCTEEAKRIAEVNEDIWKYKFKNKENQD